MKLNGMSVVAGIPFLLYNASKNKYCKGNKRVKNKVDFWAHLYKGS